MHVFHGYLLASGHLGGGFNHQKQRQLVNIYETNWMGYVLENPQFIDCDRWCSPKTSFPAQPSTVIQNEPEPEPASSNEPEPGCSNATSDSSSDAAPTLQFIFLFDRRVTLQQRHLRIIAENFEGHEVMDDQTNLGWHLPCAWHDAASQAFGCLVVLDGGQLYWN